MKVCSIDGCDRAAHARGWCPAHYQRWRHHADLGPGSPIARRGKRLPVCAVEGCRDPVRARGWCNMHWQRWYRMGDPEATTRLEHPDVCSIPGCDRPFHVRGWCRAHYSRWQRNGDPRGGRDRWPGNLLRHLRFCPPTTMPTGCIESTLPPKPTGYVRITTADGTRAYAHRASYELVRGPVPEGYHLHHRCLNPVCVNPGHLEPLTPSAHRQIHNREAA